MTNDTSLRWGELQIAVNPTNPDNIAYAVVGIGFTYACQEANDPNCDVVPTTIRGVGLQLPQPNGFFTQQNFTPIYVYTSFDRGETWERSAMPEHPVGHPELTAQGDPSITAGKDGAFYVSWDANNWGEPDDALPSAGVAVAKSTDGGKTWSDPVLTDTPVDGPKLTSDLETGTIYAASSTQRGPKSTGDPDAPVDSVNTRWVVSSTDGEHWTEPQAMGGQGGYMSAAHGTLATAFYTSGQDGLFSAANNELCGDGPAPCTIFQTTEDSGATWSRHVLDIPGDSSPFTFNWPMVAADPSEKGHFAVGVSANADAEFHVYETFDAGETWSEPTTITEDASKTHFHGYMTYSRQGVLGLVWRTWQTAPGMTVQPQAALLGAELPPYNTWVAVAADGSHFSEPLKVSRQDSPAPQSGQFGNSGDDYSGLAIEGENVYVGWADWRPKERAGYFSAAKMDMFEFASK